MMPQGTPRRPTGSQREPKVTPRRELVTVNMTCNHKNTSFLRMLTPRRELVTVNMTCNHKNTDFRKCQLLILRKRVIFEDGLPPERAGHSQHLAHLAHHNTLRHTSQQPLEVGGGAARQLVQPHMLSRAGVRLQVGRQGGQQASSIIKKY